MLTLNNISVGDKYTGAATLGPTPTCQKIIYLVANASVFAQVVPAAPSMTQGDFATQPEILLTPQAAEFQRCQGIRFRNAVGGQVARIIAQLIEPDDVIPVGGTPFTLSLSAAGGAVGGAGLVTGEIILWGGGLASPPTGTLVCDGQAVSRTTFATLFGVIGTLYGAGDGSTTFNVPDMRDRVPLGIGSGGNSVTPGANEGVAVGSRHATRHKHAVQVTDPTHNHTHNDPTHSHGITDPSHAHAWQANNGPGGAQWSVAWGRSDSILAADGNTPILGATTGISVNAGATGVTNNAAATGITAKAEPAATDPAEGPAYLALAYLIAT